MSRTDLRGIILSANETFVRISGYPREKLLGAPHNIIRHPEMPRCVFKILWDHLQAGKPISAYVKNKASSGLPYWVLASAIPIHNGYLSVRIKPSSAVLKLIQGLYPEVLAHEKKTNMESAGQFLMENVKKLGFSSYPAFMAYAFQSEIPAFLEACERQPTHLGVPSTSPVLEQMLDQVAQTASNQSFSFKKLANITQMEAAYREQSKKLITQSKTMDYLSFNMSVRAHKLGRDGSGLAIIAQNFHKSVNGFLKQVNVIELKASRLKEAIDQSVVDNSLTLLLSVMLKNYTSECIGKTSDASAIHDLLILGNSTKEFFNQSVSSQLQLILEIQDLLQEFELLKRTYTTLDMICQGGRLEGARTQEVNQAFKSFLDSMNGLVEKIKGPHEGLKQGLTEMLAQICLIHATAKNSSLLLFKLGLITKLLVADETPIERVAS